MTQQGEIRTPQKANTHGAASRRGCLSKESGKHSSEGITLDYPSVFKEDVTEHDVVINEQQSFLRIGCGAEEEANIARPDPATRPASRDV